jgi:ATPase family associated with various cellular activities (AAA)
MNFEELSAQRRLVQDFCKRHEASMLAFRAPDKKSFKLTVGEAVTKEGLGHLTTTATCIESLLACPERYRCSPASAYANDAVEFANAAIERKAGEWKSEDSAHIYCRCRGLPLTIDHLKGYDPRLARHIKRILRQLKLESGRFAIGEADLNDRLSVKKIEDVKRSWYPPNAFHTYWALEVLTRFSKWFEDESLKIEPGAKVLEKIKEGMILWSRRTLGYQISLHAAESSLLDSDQLAWSLATLLKFEPSFLADLGEQDLLREALKQLFNTQLPVGTWRHYRALFHYKSAGNAYCYVYETFAVLLQIALDGDSSRQLFREALRPYVDKLTKLWRYAESTRVSLKSENASDPSAVGWCSGHRLNQTEPESWATASVFSFAQAFRRLLGVWTREAARKDLNLVKPVFEQDAAVVLKNRGDTWADSKSVPVTDQLYTMFINPTKLYAGGDRLEPDAEPIQRHQARSAILFGPPGTSKTTLCGAVAELISWDYIELHASHFVADGLQNVQKKADDIFRRLMEIDHTVVLFDEVDELVREREDEHDAFGRFLTTSMLPKLAELWKQKKVIYFVATNHIKYFDRAITRSQRFDALILVSPPAYRAKIDQLTRILKDCGCEATFDNMEDQMWQALQEAGTAKGSATGKTDKENTLADAHMLAKFVLLRWDQLDELAVLLNKVNIPHIDDRLMTNALREIADRKLRLRAPYMDFVDDLMYPRRDVDKQLVWIAKGFDKEYLPDVVGGDDRRWLVCRRAEEPPMNLHGFQRTHVERETVHYEKKADFSVKLRTEAV